ncbi:MAG: Helix-turn-helix domain [Thermoleophilaceae bacterium]|nr:Helix-turn-helix domain [Thermoleophilaceae bacterium]
MGRHRIHVSRAEHGFSGGPRWADPYYCEWSVVVGDRIRRLRKAREWSLRELASHVERPGGRPCSAGYLSRIERGWASAPLYVYLVVADALGVAPGRLLGPDDAEREVDQAEEMLLAVLQKLEMDPAEAVARLVREPQL